MCFGGGSSSPAPASTGTKKVKDVNPTVFDEKQKFKDTHGTVVLADPAADQAKGATVLGGY